jgi:formylmethanofuran dehydrogenase subunit C
VSDGIAARLRGTLSERADCSELLPPGWGSLTAEQLADRPIYLERAGLVRFGDLFDLSGEPAGKLRLAGHLERTDRIGAGLAEGEVIIESSVGDETGLGMSGGSLDVRGNAGVRTGAAAPGRKRGMLGGELVVRGSTGVEAGSYMRRGLLVVVGNAGDRAGLGMIAGTVVIVAGAGPSTGLWSKRGSIVALGPITPPPTYALACTYQPIHLRLLLGRLRARYDLPIQRRHITGLFRRFSGDFAELGKGEILQWTAK